LSQDRRIRRKRLLRKNLGIAPEVTQKISAEV
jgi:hypothetical protein